ncbi:MAG: lactate permease [Phycisphaerales bacterium]|nr:lactate permease [Phycisphaerales bacterium]
MRGMSWSQVYTPVADNLLLSALVAAVPVVVLLGLLAGFHMRAHMAALAGLAAAILIAMFIYGMPAKLATMSALYGAAFGLFPIGWIVLCAIFVYDITVHTGQFEIVKQTIAGLADDRRIQVLLIAFSFGAFIEGAAGFGTPVAISAAMLIGLGFKPLPAAGLALIGNTAPVAFGSLGIPIITLSQVTGLDLHQLSAMAGRQLPFFSVIVPFWLVWAMAGWRSMLEVWPACAVTGLVFGSIQFFVSNFHGPWVVDIAGGAAAIIALVLLLKVWQPKTVWRFKDEEPAPPPMAVTRGQAIVAWSPWVILSLVVFVWALPPVKKTLDRAMVPVNVPSLHLAVERVPPVAKAREPEPAVFKFNWLSATGTALLVSGILSGLILRVPPTQLARLFTRSVWRVRWSLLTIAAMLALGYTTRYAGIDATMGLALASTGMLFPFFSPLLGWLGVALTGSDTSSNVLFGNLQKITAERLGISPILTAAANSSGGVMGKMIDAQSIVVAAVATNQHNKEGEILRYVFFHSIALATLVGVLVWLQAGPLRWMIPH